VGGAEGRKTKGAERQQRRADEVIHCDLLVQYSAR
jgi:hypothetical protein